MCITFKKRKSDIPVKILKEGFSVILLNKFAANLMRQFALQSFWLFQISQYCTCFQGWSRKPKGRYRPIIILLIIAKIFEKLISQELSSHFDNIFSKFQCGVRKGFCTHSLSSIND